MIRSVIIVFVALLASRTFIESTMNSRFTSFGYADETRALEVQLHSAELNGESAVAAQVQANGSDAHVTVPAPMPTATVCVAGATCDYTGAAKYQITGQPTHSLVNGNPGTSGDDEAYNLQRQQLISQNTMSLQITASVWSKGGALASRCELVTYRVISQDPYIDPAGYADCGANVGVTLEHDAGGCDPNTPKTCDPTGATPDTPTQTTITTIAECKGADCAGATPRPMDTFQDNQWQNSNQQSGWANP